jgi:uncharacterized membrane protein
MFVRELTIPRRVVFSIIGVVAFVSAMVCGMLSVTEPELPRLARVALGVGTMFGLAWTTVLARIVWRGAIDLKVDNRRIAAMVWIFTVLMMVFFLMVSMSVEDRLLGILMVSNGLAFLVGAAVYWLTHRIEQSELATHEKLLQLELRVTELIEKQ